MYTPPALTNFNSLNPAQSSVTALDTNFVSVGSLAMVHGGFAAGTPNGLTLSIPLVLSDYPVGLKVSLQPLANNTSAATLSVNGLTPLPLTDIAGTALTANALIAGNCYLFTLCQDQVGNSTFRMTGIGAGNLVTSVFGRTGAIGANSGDYTIGQIAGAGTMASQSASNVSITGGTISNVTLAVPGAVRAWVAYNGSTQTVLGQLGVGSVNRNSAGSYTVNFTAPFADTNYAAFATAGSAPSNLALLCFQNGAQTASSCTFQVSGINNSAQISPVDTNYFCASFFHS